MRPLALRYGSEDTVTLVLTEHDPADGPVRQEEEVTLQRDVDGEFVLLTAAGQPRRVEPADPAQGHRLHGLLDAAMPRVCVVLAVLDRGARQRLVIEMRSFSHHVRLEHPLTLKLDVALEEIAFADDFVLEPAAATGARVIVSSGPDQRDLLTTSFQLHGNRHNALVRGKEDGLVVHRLVPSHHGVDELVTPTALVECPAIRLASEPTAVPLDVLVNLRGAVPPQSRYFDLQERYLPLEKALALESWDRFGALSYHDVKSVGDGWYFCLDQAPTAQQRMMLMTTSLDLTAVPRGTRPVPAGESAAERAETTVADAADDRDWPNDGIFSGKAPQLAESSLGHLDDRCELYVTAASGGRPDVSGELRLATRGGKVAWERRRWAYQRMLGGDGPPRLARLLGELTGPPARRYAGPPLKQREIRTAFDGKPPTRGQARAIMIAVQTPDVAIIHGPPGTGKTRVIHAVSAQLADRAAPRALGEPQALLLTSHANEAVRNVANQTEVFDMPAATQGLKEDRARTIGAARSWADARLAKSELGAQDADVRRLLAGGSATDAQRILFDLHRTVASYELAPVSPAETAQLLYQLIESFGRNLGVDTVLDLRAKADELAATGDARGAGDEDLLTPAMRAVRGIRTVPAAWEDDGPRRAREAIEALRPLGLIAPAEADILRETTVADVEQVGAVKAVLIDRLIDRVDPPLRPGVDESVRALLLRAAAEARDAVLRGRDGIPVILAEYRDALQHDLPQVERLKREYASLIATTCQKAQDGRLLSPVGKRPRFETVIVDEAAHASPLDLLIPLCGATRRVILVGDHRQLPHVLERELEARLVRRGDDDDYADLIRRSLFEHVRDAAERQTRLDGVPRIARLDQQFRMHPRLGSVMNEVFYEPHGERVENGERKPPLHDIPDFEGRVAAWIDVPLEKGRDELDGRSTRRPVEAEKVAERIVSLRTEQPDLSLGVIAFYRAQVTAILGELAQADRGRAVERDAGPMLVDPDEKQLLVGTVDAFQGREFDVVLLSVTRSNGVPARGEESWWRKWGHLRLPNRMCVALSRQKALLLAVGDRAMATDPAARRAVPGLWQLERLCRAEEGRPGG